MAKEKYDSSRRVFVAVVSDLHIGSTVALCPPEGIALEDGGRYMPSQVQRWVWDKWQAFWQLVKQRAGMSPLIVVVNGEFVDGNHHMTSQIASPSEQQMVDAAIEVMSKPATMAKELYVTIGTKVHSGAGGGFDHLIAFKRGRTLLVETKHGKNDLNESQVKFGAAIAQHCDPRTLIYCTARSVDDVLNALGL